MDLKSLINHKPRGKKGEGRTVKFVPVNLPVDVVEDLKLYRDIYTGFLPEKISFESMFRRWFGMVAEYDPEIQKAFNEAKKSRREFAERMAAGLNITVEQLKENEAAYDPTAPENKPWLLQYFFEKDGEKLEAIPGDKAPFFAKVDGRNVGMKEMFANDWILQNEIGCELDFDQAQKICFLIRKHKAEKN